jgi:hypothetical protein
MLDWLHLSTENTTMKTRLSFVVALMLTASIAWASANILGSDITLGTGNFAVPNAPTDGWQLGYPGSLGGIQVTLTDVRDGSVGDGLDAVSAFNAYAWCYKASTIQTDGGGGWARFAALDVQAREGDGGTGALTTGNPAALTGVAVIPTGINGVDCSRIDYTLGYQNTGWDAGPLVTRITVTELN